MTTTVLAGRYELRHQLGRGGMATVYEAHDDLLDRAVAVKLLRVDGLSDETARQRFAAEARAAASLTHPHAVAVYDVGTGEDEPFIVMELVRGSTLEDVLDAEGPMETRAVVAIGSQVLAALHAAHRRGLVHRDVKPANILLPDGIVPSRPDELPGVKLADFGIAKATHDATVGLTMVGQVIGTPKYLSPEQVKGDRATPQSDLYATGVVLYEMLAGRPPFEQDSAVGLALAHREDEPPPLDEVRPGLDRNLVALVHQALSKDPTERPADANEMREALLTGSTAAPGTQLLPDAAGTQVLRARVSRSEPGGGDLRWAEPTGPAAPPPRSPRSGRLAWWFAALALVAVVGAVGALWLTQPTGRSDEPSAPAQEAPAGGADDAQPGEADGAQPGAGEQPQQNPRPEAEDEAAQPQSEPPAEEPSPPAAEDDPQPSE